MTLLVLLRLFLLVAATAILVSCPFACDAVDFDLSSVKRAANGVLDNVRSAVASDGDARQNPSWVEAVTALAAAFRDLPEEHAALSTVVFGFSPSDESYPAAVCGKLLARFVRCVPPSADTAGGVVSSIYATLFDKGTTRSRAWDFEVTAHLQRNITVAAIRWSKLPYNVKAVRIIGVGGEPSVAASDAGVVDDEKMTSAAPAFDDLLAAEEQKKQQQQQRQRVDMGMILGMIPPHVSRLFLSAVDVFISPRVQETTTSAKRAADDDGDDDGGKRNQAKLAAAGAAIISAVSFVDELESLEMHGCSVEESFLETSGGWFALVTKLVVSNCVFYQQRRRPEQATRESLVALVRHWAAPMDLLRDVVIRDSAFFPVADERGKRLLPVGDSVDFVAAITTGKEFVTQLEFVAPAIVFRRGDDKNREAMPAAEAKLYAEQRRRVSLFFTALAQLKSLKQLHIANLPIASVQDGQQSAVSMQLPPHLEVLRLRNCGYAELPDLSLLPESVAEVDFSDNDLSEFPYRELAAAPRVTRVRLANNRMAGGLATARLPHHLLELNCSANALSGPLDLTALPPRIEVFDVSRNRLTGRVNMRQLPDSARHVLFSHNKLTGRYDVSRLPLLLVRILFDGNDWDSIMPKH